MRTAMRGPTSTCRAITGETLPAVGTGCGQTVAGIDYDGNGRRDFLVLNGRKKVAGPVQLFTLR
ncbi:hypothetical protein BH18ACT15_BH18ACT15_06750 [soil metagenome]